MSVLLFEWLLAKISPKGEVIFVKECERLERNASSRLGDAEVEEKDST